MLLRWPMSPVLLRASPRLNLVILLFLCLSFECESVGSILPEISGFLGRGTGPK